MSMQVGSNRDNAQIVLKSKASFDKDTTKPAFKSYEEEPKASKGVKIGTFFTTLAGVATSMYFVFKKNKSVNFDGIKNFDGVKNYFKAFTNVKYDEKSDELAWSVAKLGIGSVTGGLLGGIIFDKKENYMAKVRESVTQLVGNIGIPLLFVAGGGKLFEKHLGPKIVDMFNLKSFKWDKAVKIPQILAQTGLLVAGIFAGNSMGNAINKTFFKVDEKRKIKLSDMSPHLDDVCVSASLVFKESEKISRFVPPALMIAGYSAGTAQEAPLRVEKQKIISAQKAELKKQKALEKLSAKNNA